jgi:hypothetical protein
METESTIPTITVMMQASPLEWISKLKSGTFISPIAFLER